jgi:hypothetical protein
MPSSRGRSRKTGRLSMQRKPASSKTLRAVDLPAPESPVMMVKVRDGELVSSMA